MYWFSFVIWVFQHWVTVGGWLTSLQERCKQNHSFMTHWGCDNVSKKQTRDSIGYICIGQEDRGGYGPDAGCMTKVRGEREQRLRQGPGVTSGLGGRV